MLHPPVAFKNPDREKQIQHADQNILQNLTRHHWKTKRHIGLLTLSAYHDDLLSEYITDTV